MRSLIFAHQFGNGWFATGYSKAVGRTLSTALRDTGATNGQIVQLTETLQKIGRIGGVLIRGNGERAATVWPVDFIWSCAG